MSRMQKKFKRGENVRDAKLICIAVEGTITEKIYFESLAATYRNRKTRVVIVPRENTDSSPTHIIRNIKEYFADYDKQMADEVYLVLDRDRWQPKMLADVEKACFEKSYVLIMSNPCFELWLLLHKEDVSTYSREEKEKIRKNKRTGRSKSAKKYLEKLLSDRMRGFDKCSEASIKKLIPKVKIAILYAKRLKPPSPEERGWPDKDIGTQVHYVAEKIIG
jgi:hypothetical protein